VRKTTPLPAKATLNGSPLMRDISNPMRQQTPASANSPGTSLCFHAFTHWPPSTRRVFQRRHEYRNASRARRAPVMSVFP
jgi:hypothetical protein